MFLLRKATFPLGTWMWVKTLSYADASSCLPLQTSSCPTFQFLLLPTVSCPSLTWDPCVLSAIPSPGPKGSAAAAFSLKAERGDHSPDFSHPPPLQEQVRDAEVLFSLPKSGAPLPQCPPEQRDACSQREGRTQPGGVLGTEPGRKELGKQKRVQSGFPFCYGCYYLFIHVFFFIKEEMA